jgi:membrane protein implicated in regulation of membrane protease activity
MNRPVFFLAWLSAVLAAIASFNLLIGVFGLNEAIVSLVIFVIFAVFTCRHTQSERKEPHA